MLQVSLQNDVYYFRRRQKERQSPKFCQHKGRRHGEDGVLIRSSTTAAERDCR